MRRITLLLMFVSFSITAQNNSLTSDLLLHYKFDGNVKDFSENNYDGIVSGVTYLKGRKGVTDSIALFDGIDDYIDFPNVEMLKPNLPVTLALWVNFDNLSNEQSVLFTTDYQEDNHSGIWASLSSGKIAISYGDATGNTTGGNRRSKIGTTELSANEWYHIVFVVRDAEDMDIYINGINDGGTYSGTSTNGLGYTTNPGSIGRKDSHTSLPTYYFKGALDDFRYWGKELSELGIETLYNLENDSTLSNTLSISDFSILIYPNPTKGFFKIKTKKRLNKIVLYNIIGKKVLEFNTALNEFSLNNLPKGIYFLRITINNNIVNQKIILK